MIGLYLLILDCVGWVCVLCYFVRWCGLRVFGSLVRFCVSVRFTVFCVSGLVRAE